MLKVLDLFSGVGGFSLGLESTGRFETTAFCEIDVFKQSILRKHWPGVPIYADATALPYDEIEKPDVITGGYPCQGESLAGKRRGADDDRWLWPAMREAIAVLRPAWAIGENADGHTTMGLSTVLADLESLGYEVWPASIPACAVGAPHIRKRSLWVACSLPYSEEGRWEQRGRLELTPPSNPRWGIHNGKYQSEPPRVADGLPRRMDRNAALGDSLVPQMVAIVGQAIAAVQEEYDREQGCEAEV